MRDEGQVINQDIEINTLLMSAWEKVFMISNRIIAHASQHGYGIGEMGRLVNPNLKQLGAHLEAMEALLKILSKFGFDHDDQRSCLNALRQIGVMKILICAYEIGDQEMVYQAIGDMKRQAVL